MTGNCVVRYVVVMAAGFLFLYSPLSLEAAEKSREFHGVYAGMSEKKFFSIYPLKKARTYRKDADETWITFSDPLNGKPLTTVTFHLKNEKVISWELDDRAEVITEYLGEFCTGLFLQKDSLFGVAIRDVLARMPREAFLNVTDRRSPVVFTEVYDAGTAQFANSAEIISSPEDPLAFENGLTILKLSTGLESGGNVDAIKGVIAHELAHKVLDHMRSGRVNCESERETNRLIKAWGFEKEYEAASAMFGREKVGGPASCQGK